MKIKIIAGLAFVLNTFLFGTYYSVSKGALGHIDPIVFTFFAMMTLVPPAICLIAFTWRHITREIVRSGFLLGSCLCLGLFTLSVALKYNTATGTAFFPALNGLLAAIVTWLFLRQPIHKTTWFAGIISVAGAVLLMMNSSMGGLRGSIIAFIGGLFTTLYIFLADHEQRDKKAYWSLFAVELLTMALWANLIALLFGEWQTIQFSLPNDLMAILYIGLGTTLLPTLITILLQNYISPVTVSFIYILEPIFGAVVATLYLHELLPFYGYIGGGLIVAGVLIHTCGTVRHPSEELIVQRRLSQASQRIEASLLSSLIYPLLCCGVGVFIVYKLGGFPPVVWLNLYILREQLPIQIQQGHGMDVLLLVAQALSWLVAWLALLFMGGLTSYRIFSKLFSTPQPIELDVRTLRQLGITPYTVSPTRNRTDKQLVQRRRRNRRMRLAHIEELNVETWSEHEVPLWSPTDATSTSGYRKSAPLESPAALNGSSASTHGLPAAANWSPNNVNTSIYNSSVPAASTDAASTSGYRKSIPLRSLANANGSPAASGSTPLVQPVLHSLANESQRIIDRLADTSTQNWWDYETVEMGITLPGRGLPSKIRWSSE